MHRGSAQRFFVPHVQMVELYEHDHIFDKFGLSVSGDGTRVATGSYSNLFRVIDVSPNTPSPPDGQAPLWLEASRDPMRRRQPPTTVRPTHLLGWT